MHDVFSQTTAIGMAQNQIGSRVMRLIRHAA
jgi:hypothetical protein